MGIAATGSERCTARSGDLRHTRCDATDVTPQELRRGLGTILGAAFIALGSVLLFAGALRYTRVKAELAGAKQRIALRDRAVWAFVALASALVLAALFVLRAR
jgi:hypothetical protein